MAGLVLGIWMPTVGLVATIGVVVVLVGAIAPRIRAGGEQRKHGIPADSVLLLIAAVAVVIAAAAS